MTNYVELRSLTQLPESLRPYLVGLRLGISFVAHAWLSDVPFPTRNPLQIQIYYDSSAEAKITERRHSVTQMFCDLGLPTFNTVIHNTRVRFESTVDTHDNKLVMHVFHTWWMFFFFVCYMLYVLMSVCLSVCLSSFYIHCFSTSFYGPCCLK